MDEHCHAYSDSNRYIDADCFADPKDPNRDLFSYDYRYAYVNTISHKYHHCYIYRAAYGYAVPNCNMDPNAYCDGHCDGKLDTGAYPNGNNDPDCYIYECQPLTPACR